MHAVTSNDAQDSEGDEVDVVAEDMLLDDFLKVSDVRFRYRRRDSTQSPVLRRLVVDRGDSAAAVAWHRERECFLLVRQFRYPAHVRGSGWLVEVPAGTVEQGESPEATIRRELEEELGYRCSGELQRLATVLPSPGADTERIFIFFLEVDEGDRVGAGVGVGDEDIEHVEHSLAETRDMLRSNDIVDAKTVIGLQRAIDWIENKPEGTRAVAEPTSRDCFVVMPFGEKVDAEGRQHDFDTVYEQLIKPAIEEAEDLGLECVRCDKLPGSNWIHRDMFEYIASASVVVCDITTLNPNVFYELGIRHALRDKVTVLLKRRGAAIPFNIEGLRVISYEPEFREPKDTKEEIRRYIRAGLKNLRGDSPVHEVLDPPPLLSSKPITKREFIEYPVGDRLISIVTGNLADVDGVAIWVNSENTLMEMARPDDGSISGLIRCLSTERNGSGTVTWDMAKELRKQVGKKRIVAGDVEIIGAHGELKQKGVTHVVHVAAVEGTPGLGYRPVQDVGACVRNVLEKVDSKLPDHVSVLFPLMGTGTARGDLVGAVETLIGRAATYLEQHPHTKVDEVLFLAYTRRDLDACKAALGRLDLKPSAEPQRHARPSASEPTAVPSREES
jgi:nudix-type nucleoside diphosphatase (YffH/AdpP family)